MASQPSLLKDRYNLLKRLKQSRQDQNLVAGDDPDKVYPASDRRLRNMPIDVAVDDHGVSRVEDDLKNDGNSISKDKVNHIRKPVDSVIRPMEDFLESQEISSKKDVVKKPPPVRRDVSRGVERAKAEELFLSSCVADEDPWLEFQVEENVPANCQLQQLTTWLHMNRPSQVHRSDGVGWIAVKLRDKGKKVLEAKAAWDVHEGQKSMAVVNELAKRFSIAGGKWMCHLPRDSVDQIWAKVARALLGGSLGQHVYMVKVSPVEDINPSVSRGDHVLIVYNTDYTDTKQVMRVENRLRSVELFLPLNYKPDVFSALGIYRNNAWGFRPTIYTSRFILSEGRSRVEAVGTGKWYYNSDKGLQRPDEEEVTDYEDVLIEAALNRKFQAESKDRVIVDAIKSSEENVKGIGRVEKYKKSKSTVLKKTSSEKKAVLKPTASETQADWLAKLADLKLKSLDML